MRTDTMAPVTCTWTSRIWRSALFLAAALGALLPAAAEANILITIDKNSQQMRVAVDGAERYAWPVSTGRPGYDTPSGSFKPNRMDADHFSQEWDNAPMPQGRLRSRLVERAKHRGRIAAIENRIGYAARCF